jgi:hypothetical protein
MRSLQNQIARLEMRAEQILIHLRSIPRDTVEAEKNRSDLLAIAVAIGRVEGAAREG